ncbi:hypothetical protein OBBRIDRAFT_874355, partial [Obba rivulosa]
MCIAFRHFLDFIEGERLQQPPETGMCLTPDPENRPSSGGRCIRPLRWVTAAILPVFSTPTKPAIFQDLPPSGSGPFSPSLKQITEAVASGEYRLYLDAFRGFAGRERPRQPSRSPKRLEKGAKTTRYSPDERVALHSSYTIQRKKLIWAVALAAAAVKCMAVFRTPYLLRQTLRPDARCLRTGGRIGNTTHNNKRFWDLTNGELRLIARMVFAFIAVDAEISTSSMAISSYDS